jgi:CheY-like chemotaxis protein
MKAHGGSLTVESEKGKGSTFYARLPDIKSLIGIADYDEVQRDIFKEQIKDVSNAEIVEIQNGNMLFDLLATTQLTLLIFDMALPDADGFETIKKISKKFTFPFFVTTMLPIENAQDYTVDEIRNKVKSLGAVEFIEKPIIPAKFLQLIKKYLD